MQIIPSQLIKEIVSVKKISNFILVADVFKRDGKFAEAFLVSIRKSIYT